MMESTSTNVPQWKVSGDWFDVCNCKIPCPCTFAQAPTYGDCDGVLAYNIENGYYGKTHSWTTRMSWDCDTSGQYLGRGDEIHLSLLL